MQGKHLTKKKILNSITYYNIKGYKNQILIHNFLQIKNNNALCIGTR